MFFLSVLLETKIFLRACCKIRSGKAASREQNEKGGDATTVREQRGLATGPPQSVRDRKIKMPDAAFGGAVLVGRAESFCPGPSPVEDLRQLQWLRLRQRVRTSNDISTNVWR